jgi:hypothetical protein
MAIIGLELRGNPDGTAMLNRWDSIGGEDTVLRLSPDGTVHELSYPDGDDETEIWTPVDLVAQLMTLCAPR